MKNYNFYNDPSHGWLGVKIAELEKLGIIDNISGYSYMKGKTAYLEEDCDISVFLDAKEKAKQGYRLINKYTNNRSIIRTYNSFNK